MSIARTLNFKKFLIMPPAFYKYSDNDVINFYSKIIDAHPECEIVLYNFEKLCGHKFSAECIQELVKLFPKQIIGVKDSSYAYFPVVFCFEIFCVFFVCFFLGVF
jgi:4-hydroxy-tetrahydrodipicolinate synthase